MSRTASHAVARTITSGPGRKPARRRDPVLRTLRLLSAEQSSGSRVLVEFLIQVLGDFALIALLLAGLILAGLGVYVVM